ncbi:hypothetical protein Fcan01_28555 [Folsomia candida]|uniref:Uncharacterized protein n=1 Tax=Folsomia candida TaxID=158441 RepID=A0A226CVQ2_FOLCA|nr:hypothetical protein Fcan01_28555 [Folsomia candida]
MANLTNEGYKTSGKIETSISLNDPGNRMTEVLNALRRTTRGTDTHVFSSFFRTWKHRRKSSKGFNNPQCCPTLEIVNTSVPYLDLYVGLNEINVTLHVVMFETSKRPVLEGNEIDTSTSCLSYGPVFHTDLTPTNLLHLAKLCYVRTLTPVGNYGDEGLSDDLYGEIDLADPDELVAKAVDELPENWRGTTQTSKVCLLLSTTLDFLFENELESEIWIVAPYVWNCLRGKMLDDPVGWLEDVKTLESLKRPDVLQENYGDETVPPSSELTINEVQLEWRSCEKGANYLNMVVQVEVFEAKGTM